MRFPCARFDDLTPGAERAFSLRGLQRHIIARRHEDVVSALEEVETAVADGAWAAGFVAYEAAPAFDRALTVRRREFDDPLRLLPLVWFAVFDRMEPFDPAGPREDGPVPYSMSRWRPSVPRAEYDEAIDHIHDRIGAGDTYQVNYSLRLRASVSGETSELYRCLAVAQRGPFNAYLDAGRFRVLSASPELFFRMDDDDRIVTRPMKGTIRRGRWPEEDAEFAARLTESEKDRAENLMIVDLIRNDLGKVAVPGSVEATSLCQLERFETVWQLTSTIEAKLESGTSVTDVFKALFPSGSVTGAPKASTMKIISDLESDPRGVYCGAIGYLAPPGSGMPRAAFNVAIRTVVVDQEEGVAEYGVGGGITWDSHAGAEYDEVRAKAGVLTERRRDFSLVETLLHDSDGYHLLDEHLERIEASAAHFGFNLDRGDIQRELVMRAPQSTARHRVRVEASRDGTVRIEDQPLAPRPEPVRLGVDEVPIDSGNVFLFHKTTRRSVYDERTARHPDCDDVVLVNERGEITETTIANIAVQFAGEWWTPPLDSGCLPGTMRRHLLDEGKIKERVMSASELDSAEAIAVFNSVRGWQSAVLAGRALRSAGGFG
ncbi:MAG: aminodeoxychorismate synthase component I [Acidimicrobiia bacterium]|nr:aminodeoxychorismate synthase component I [Acidimicrobiia bacterium]